VSALRTSWGAPGFGVVVVVVVGLLTAVAPAPVAAASPGASFHSGPCPGSGVPTVYNGTLRTEGGPAPSSVTGHVPLRADFQTWTSWYEEPGDHLLSQYCAPLNVTSTTTSDGSFTAELFLPSSNCSAPGVTLCAVDQGFYGPVQIAPTSRAPTGYLLSSKLSGTWAVLEWVAELTSVALTPSSSTVTVSSGDPSTFVATPEMANGSTSPLSPDFRWGLNGTGWSMVGSNDSNRTVVEAAPGATPGTLNVRASDVLGSVTLTTPMTTVGLIAVSTSVGSGELNRTTLDAGGTVAARVTAVGAAGYGYRATFAPGLGFAAVGAACSSSPGSAGLAEVVCGANLSYPSPGTAQPSVNVTNGFSSATWTFAEVEVEPPPALSVTPTVPEGYAGQPLAVAVTVASGSGVAPFSEACLLPGDGGLLCSSAPGPTWTFRPTYPSAGNFTAEAWAVDADQVNRSVTFSVTVVAPLGVGSIGLSPSAPAAGNSVTVTASLAGGVLPLRFWWNVTGSSGAAGTGVARADGPVAFTFVPSGAGPVEVSLAAVDALGTVAERSTMTRVAPAPAARLLAVVASPAAPVVVGTAVPVEWEAVDLTGALVPGFAAGAEVGLSNANGSPMAGWVNSSGVGPLSAIGGGWFGVPAEAWVGGSLRLTVEPAEAGVLWVELAGSSLPGGPSRYPIDVTPDLDHVVLYAPDVVHPGLRSNSTFWHAMDRYGDPVAGAQVALEIQSPDGVWVFLRTVEPLGDGTTGLWVNYTVPVGGAVTVTVRDHAGEVLLGPLAVPAAGGAAPPDPLLLALAVAAPVGVAGAALSVMLRGRRRTGPADSEAELARLAEGESRVVELLRRAGALDLPGLEAAWETAPVPPELADWVASLVADGTLTATVGPDRVARFCLARRPTSRDEVTVDPAVFDAALARRAAETTETGEAPT